jgi:hypothetical protein
MKKAIILHRFREPRHMFVEISTKQVELVRPCAFVVLLEDVDLHHGERVDPVREVGLALDQMFHDLIG